MVRLVETQHKEEENRPMYGGGKRGAGGDGLGEPGNRNLVISASALVVTTEPLLVGGVYFRALGVTPGTRPECDVGARSPVGRGRWEGNWAPEVALKVVGDAEREAAGRWVTAMHSAWGLREQVGTDARLRAAPERTAACSG